MTKGTTWQNIILMPCLIFDDAICDVMLLCFTNFTTSLPFLKLNCNFQDIFISVMGQNDFLCKRASAQGVGAMGSHK